MASFLVTVFIVKLFLVGAPSAIVYKLAYQLSLICCALVKVCLHLDCLVIVDVVNYNLEAEPFSIIIIPPLVALGDKRLIPGCFFSALFSVAASVRDLFFPPYAAVKVQPPLDRCSYTGLVVAVLLASSHAPLENVVKVGIII
jgi:hypothetical protein